MRISDWSSDVCSSDLMPTDTGLRLFVDGMMQALEPSADERAAIEARIERGSGPIEDALAATTAALSGLSACAGLVFVPQRELVVRQFAFVALSHEQALAEIGRASCRERGCPYV